METLVREHNVDHMKNNKLFSTKQYGFISGRSTSLQLLAVLDKWTEAIDNGNSIDVIYMEFQKAFYTVSHGRLISKLDSYAISTTLQKWISDFLIGRLQKVTVGGCDSSWYPVTSGIPQGSVLGPILFVLYINDLPDLVDSDAFLFADDTKVYRIITDTADSGVLQSDLNKLDKWSDTWLIKYNASKCKHMNIGGKSTNMVKSKYELNGQELETVTLEKDIGLYIDEKLSFENHICEKVKKANSMFGMIRRNFQFLDEDMFIPLYKTYVRSHLDFASSVWAPYKIKHIEQLESVQRRATKQIPGYRDMPYPERLKKLKLPTLSYRRLRGDLIEVYKITNKIYDSNVHPILKYWNDMAPRTGTRGHSKKLYPQQAKLEIRKNAFALRVVKHWNQLPEEIVSAPSVNSFKNRLDRHLQNTSIVYEEYKP